MNHSLAISYAPYAESKSLYQLDMADLERLHRFQTRTSTAMSTPVTKYAYQHEMIRLIDHVGLLLEILPQLYLRFFSIRT
jgi:hypothetical protein